MSKPDGSVIIDTKLDTSGVEKGTKEVKEQLEGIGEDSKSAGEKLSGGLSGGFKALGAAIVASGVIDALVDFGKQAIELGSDLEEVQNVVDVTFKTMSKQVNNFAKDAKKTAGLSEKMAKQYVGTFGAMADSFGFAEEEAFEMSTTLTQLTGDVASFYNLQQDEAYTKLKSIFTGETESLKDLGVVMTQTALDAYALANGFGKVTDDMTEQEKVALRYRFVVDQLSSASGDFVRTQEGWANQSRMLSLQWESFMATIGSGLIEVLSPAVEFINNFIMPALQNLADGFAAAFEPTPTEELLESLDGVKQNVGDLEEQFEKSTEEIEKSANMARVYKKRLEDLEKSGLDTAEAQEEYAIIVSQLNEIYPDLNLQIDKNTGRIDENSRALLENIEAMREQAFYAAAQEKLSGIISARAEAELSVHEAMRARSEIETQRILQEQELTQATGLSTDALIRQYNAQMAANQAMQMSAKVPKSVAENYGIVATATDVLTDEQMELAGQLYALISEENNLNAAISDGKALMDQYDTQMEELREAYGLTADAATETAESQAVVSEAVEKTRSNISGLKEEYDDAKEAAKESLESQIGMFDKVEIKSSTSAEKIIKNWKSQQKAFTDYKDNLQKAVDMGLDETLVKQLSDGSTESMAILDEFVNGTDLSVEEINAAFSEVQQSKDTVAATMADINTEMTDKLSNLESEVSDSWGDMAQIVRDEIKAMQTAINSLKGKTVTLTVNTKNTTAPGSTGKQSTSNTPVPYALENASVPYLASGAVIPPNAPFMAVLGDQRRGTNVEAPLTTIQEAVANVMDGQTSAILAGFEMSIGVQREILAAVLGIHIGDDAIVQAVSRYNAKMAVVRGY